MTSISRAAGFVVFLSCSGPLAVQAATGALPAGALPAGAPPAGEALSEASQEGSTARASRDAIQLFEEGRKLLEQGDYEGACDAFRKSVQVEVHVGPLLNLGLCLAAQKSYASAHRHYLQAAALAAKLGDDREAFARREAAALEPKVQRLRAVFAKTDRTTRVLLNGEQVRVQDLEQGIAVDPGRYQLEVQQADRQSVQLPIVVEKDRPLELIEIAALAPREEEKPRAPVSVAPGSPSDEAFIQPWMGLAASGVGIALVGAGGVLYGTGSSAASASDCRPDTLVCSAEGKEERDAAAARANVGIPLMAAGGVLTVGGVVAYFLLRQGGAPSEFNASRLRVDIAHRPESGVLASLSGRF